MPSLENHKTSQSATHRSSGKNEDRYVIFFRTKRETYFCLSGYFPSGCESNEDRMKYLMDAFNWRHRKNTCAPWFKETQPRPEDLLRFHNQGRHLQGFFRFERHARTGEVFLVDIYYRHKFPSSDSIWTTKQTEHFDELNMFYENFSHFLRMQVFISLSILLNSYFQKP